MRTTLTWAIGAVLLGCAAGAALGYWEARPWTILASSASKSEGQPAVKSAGNEPQAVISETTYNFDKMESGTTQRHTFTLKNAGSSSLTLEFVSHTCKCTTVELEGRPVEPGAQALVKPGEEIPILLEWEAKVPAGTFRHGATFATNDPVLSQLELRVEGDIVDSTTLFPSTLNFGSVRIGQTGKAEMIVMSFLEPEVQILTHEVTDAKLAERMKVTIEPVAKEQLPDSKALTGVKLVATYEPGGSIGPFAASLKFTTNLKRAPNLVAPIFGTVKGDISLYGTGWTEQTGILRMPSTSSAAGVSSTLQVTLAGPHAKSTTLSVARVDPPELKATLGTPKPVGGKIVQVPLTVELPAGTRPMVRAGEDLGGWGEIVLATTHPETPEVRLRVAFTVKP
jgi:hypothetical protein